MLDKIFDLYFKNYKKILILTFMLLLLNLGIILNTYLTTGSFVYMDSSLKGGVSFTFTHSESINTAEFEEYLINNLGTSDIDIIMLKSQLTNTIIGYDIQTEEGITQEQIQTSVETYINKELNPEDISFGTQSSVIGESFLNDALKLFIVGFFLMALVSYLYFKDLVPALSITFSTFSDFIGVIAVLNLFQIKLGVATIGALLMIIGYSTDSDILLATNMLKRKDGSLKERIRKAVNTETMLALTAMLTFSIMFILSSVELIKHIALVLLIGIVFDVINTYGQNAGIQRLYAERFKK